MKSLKRTRFDARLDLSASQTILIVVCLFELIRTDLPGNIMILQSSQISHFNTTKSFFKNSYTSANGNILTKEIQNQFHDSNCLHQISCARWGHSYQLSRTTGNHSTREEGNNVFDIPSPKDFEVTQSNISNHPVGKSNVIGISNSVNSCLSLTTFQGANLNSIYKDASGNISMERVNLKKNKGTQMFIGREGCNFTLIKSVFIENSFDSPSNVFIEVNDCVSFGNSFSSGTIGSEIGERPMMIGTVVRLDYECEEVFTQLFTDIGVKKDLLVGTIVFAVCA